MKIREFIQTEVLLPRLKKHETLVVYDPENRYRDLCAGMAGESIRVIDASEDSIASREAALKSLSELGRRDSGLRGLLVYVPVKAPVTDREMRRDPFATYTVCGGRFPDGDGDEFMSLCIKARPDFAAEIRRVFKDNPDPTFAVIDAVGGRGGWPNLQALLRLESARDMLFALMAPSETQIKALEKGGAWASEAEDLFLRCLGWTMKIRDGGWASLADDLWRFVLYSEFVFDLPEALPRDLEMVPRAEEEARSTVEDLCDRLRNDQRCRALYIDRAEGVEKELDLAGRCRTIRDLGVRDTFPFEERTFLAQAVDALNRDDVDKARDIVASHADTVWVGKGESQARWGLIRAALALHEAVDDHQSELPGRTRSLDDLIDYYVNDLREVDRLHREFEGAVVDCFDAHVVMSDLIEKTRGRYRAIAAAAHEHFIRHVERSGWPPPGRPANADLFDDIVAPMLRESGRKVGFFLVDALRYELGAALQKQLAEDDRVEIHPVLASLPSITAVGMASLLPGAGEALTLTRSGGAMVPALGEEPLPGLHQRMKVLRREYGQRFAETPLGKFTASRAKIPDSVELLVLRSVEIDTQLETAPETAPGLIHDALKRIRVAIHKLKGMGFHDVVIATDHGFCLNTHAGAGDVCAKPPGDWIALHGRFVLGDGAGDAANFILPAARLGIRGDFTHAGGPRGLVPLRAGELFFHGGASLQECVAPALIIRLGQKPASGPGLESGWRPTVRLTYKTGAARVTTRLPVVDVLLDVEQLGLFSMPDDLELLLEAHDKRGQVVGVARAGGAVNPASGTVTITPNRRVQVPVKMRPDFEGPFTIKAMNPVTLAVYCKLSLETDYMGV